MDRRRRPHRAAELVRRGRPDALRSAACGQRPRSHPRAGPVPGRGDPARPAGLALARRRGRGLAAVLDLPRTDPRRILTAAGPTRTTSLAPDRTVPGGTAKISATPSWAGHTD